MSFAFPYELQLITVIVVAFVFGLGLLLIRIPEHKALKNYRIFRIVMACTYLMLCLIYVFMLLKAKYFTDPALARCATLSISALQAFFFTFSFLALIDTKFITWKKVFSILTHILLITLGAFSIYLFPGNQVYFHLIFTLMIAYYILLLAYFTRIFLHEFALFDKKLDNYYSEGDAHRMRWIFTSLFASLGLGIFALFPIIFYKSVWARSLFNIYLCIYYAYFAIRYINYAFQFETIEQVVTDNSSLPSDKAINPIEIEDGIERAVRQWIRNERYLREGLTIETVARELQTNRTYLSAYINHTEKQTFREWINALRIQKAKELLLNTNYSIAEIALRIGYSDSSNFNKQFAKHTGMTAKLWRETMVESHLY